MSEKRPSRFTTHLSRVGAYVAAFFWLALVYTGVVLVSRRYSDLAGWTILVLAAVVMISTMNHWVKYLPVIFGSAILGGLLATGTGHLLNDTKPFPRPIAAALTALLIGCGLISRTLAGRNLRMFDRVALIAFLAAFVGGLVKNTPTAGLISLGIGFGCLLAAWVRDRLSSVPSHESGDVGRN
jgi:hypothetical protein